MHKTESGTRLQVSGAFKKIGGTGKLKLLCILTIATFFTIQSYASDKTSLNKVEPPFWWTGMKSHALQLMVYGENISTTKLELNYEGVTINSLSTTDNPNYLFVDLEMESNVKPGTFDLVFKKKNKIVHTYNYELKKRRTDSSLEGFNSSDVIYLITPDRFANGNPDNDEITGMVEGLARDEPFGRHGGDIRGIIDNLDYIKDLGFTAIWLNPLLENNQPEESYHGYATTDFYKVDPRFGTNEEYRELVAIARKKGLKVIMDMILNHCGSEHWWMKDMPMQNWINNYPDYVITNHRRTVNQDPYASKADKDRMVNGWFVPSMPDMNQNNDFVANYLITNSIWWAEFLGLSGIRQDTYPYPDKYISAEWTRRIMEEYPRFNIVGEEWSTNPAIVSYWQRGKNNSDGYKSWLPGVMDFPLQNALNRGLNEEENWSDGLIKIYEALANDFQYADPGNLVIFPDNHDMSRIYTQLNEDIDLLKMALTFILTTRGIPQIYYGTEILMSNPGTDSHGIIRSDFPGGWKGDKINAFKGKGITKQQKEIQDFIRKLLNWRKDMGVIHNGNLTHFVPDNGIYTYFRYNGNESVMVVLNKNEEPVSLETKRFEEQTKNFSSGYDIISGNTFSDIEKINVPAKSAMIIELK